MDDLWRAFFAPGPVAGRARLRTGIYQYL